MQTLTIEILNKKAINLLKDLEALQLIRVKTEPEKKKTSPVKYEIYKGSMSKQTVAEVNKQLDELRESWE